MYCSPNITKEGGELSVPLYNRPCVRIFDKAEHSVAINTNQAGRTFQDRTFVFRVANRPSSIGDGDKIWNLGFRGRRGNIVQAYPSTEYFPHPEELVVEKNDWIHFQGHGSDFNAAKNPNNGEGWQYSDRYGILEVYKQWNVMPKHKDDVKLWNEDVAEKMATCEVAAPTKETGSEFEGITLDNCVTYEEYLADESILPEGVDDFDQYILNCAKMNHCGNKHVVTWRVDADDGTYWYTDLRNNNFSNRNSKGRITVVKHLGVGEWVGIAIAIAACIGAGCAFGVYKYKNRIGATAGSSHMAV